MSDNSHSMKQFLINRNKLNCLKTYFLLGCINHLTSEYCNYTKTVIKTIAVKNENTMLK